MGGCATKIRKAFEAEDKGQKPEPVVEVEVEEDKKKTAETEMFKERVKEIVGEDENENEIAVVDEIQGCKQRPSLSLLFKQEAAKEWAENEKPKNETKEKQEPISEAQEQEPTRPMEEKDKLQQHHEIGKIQEEQREASQQTKSEDVAESSASQKFLTERTQEGKTEK